MTFSLIGALVGGAIGTTAGYFLWIYPRPFWLTIIQAVANELARRGRCWELRGPDGSVYLRRFVVFGQTPEEDSPPSLSLYIHNIRARDPDKGMMHLHPWPWSLSAVASGGYLELRQSHRGGPKSLDWVKAPAINRLDMFVAHEVVEVLPDTWTVFACGRDAGSSWGFVTPGGEYIQWRAAKESGLVKTSAWVRVDENGDSLPQENK